MTIVISSVDGGEMFGTRGGVSCTIPKSLTNGDYLATMGISEKPIYLQNNVYNAFPDLRKIGSSLVGTFSSGIGHGNSQRLIMVRSDDNGANWVSTVFYENLTTETDTSLLDGLMSTGDVTFFRTRTVIKTVSGYDIYNTSIVPSGGVDYAVWGVPIKIGSTYYRTAYGVNSLSNTETVLLQSTDNGITWTVRSIMASISGRNFSEGALIECSDGSLFSVIREDGFSSTRPLVWVRSTDGGLTWTAPVQYNPALINGTQPNLIKLPSNKLILLTGDRVGVSGQTDNGVISSNRECTGISVWQSLDTLGNSWTSRYMLSTMWSTDGGQPVAVSTGGTSVSLLCYLSKLATNNELGNEPGIYHISFSAGNML